MPHAAYMICTTPRSGSTLLCDMLAATGVAGRPESLFYGPSLDDWMETMAVDDTGTGERELLGEIVASAIALGRTKTDVFALRQQLPGLAFLCEKLGDLHPDASTDRERIERTFGKIRFIHLKRANKLEQAVSHIKAQQTGLWHVAADGSDRERIGPPGELQYDAEKIRTQMEILTGYDQAWSTWFDCQGIEPLRLTYDALCDDPTAVLRQVLEALDLDPASADGIKPGIRKMADATSRDWIARFTGTDGR